MGASVIVDNVFATPLFHKPLQLGADIVVYSATKHIDGQGRVLSGAILGSSEFINNHVRPMIRHTGPSMSPFNAWILLKGLDLITHPATTTHRRLDTEARDAAGSTDATVRLSVGLEDALDLIDDLDQALD